MNVILPQTATPTPFRNRTHDVRVTANVKYGSGGIDYAPTSGPARFRDLKLDVYEPVGRGATPRPALILAFGGAFHRGSKETDEFGDGEGVSTPVAEYCRRFAERGYVCFCIDYRLTQEQPDPGVTPVLAADEPVNKDRINVVRGMLGLPPATNEQLANGIEASTDDIASAVAFVRSRARGYGVDISRIAIGGFSAGGIIALNAAFAERVPVAAVVSLSGRFLPSVCRTCATGADDEPAVLLIVGERDLPAIADGVDETVAHLKLVGVRHRFARLPGATHFYPATTRIPTDDGTGLDVETLMSDFLYEHLRLSRLAEGTPK